MEEIIERGETILEKITSLDFSSLTLMDLVFAAGVIALVVLAVKITKKLLKLLFILLAVGLIIGWLFQRGVFSIF